MSRESSLKGQNGSLDGLAEEILYSPTPEDVKLKATFLTLVEGNPLVDPQNLPIAEAERILGRKLANKEKPGFAAWFLNRDENRQRLEYLFTLALNAAEDILCNTDPKAQSARVNMVKVVSELASKYPRTQAPAGAGDSLKSLAASIGTMDRVQLKALMSGSAAAIQVTGTNSPSIPPESEDGEAGLDNA